MCVDRFPDWRAACRTRGTNGEFLLADAAAHAFLGLPQPLRQLSVERARLIGQHQTLEPPVLRDRLAPQQAVPLHELQNAGRGRPAEAELFFDVLLKALPFRARQIQDDHGLRAGHMRKALRQRRGHLPFHQIAQHAQLRADLMLLRHFVSLLTVSLRT